MANRRVPLVQQMEATECGPAALTMILKYYGHHAPLSEVRERCGSTRDGVSALKLKQVAQAYGLECRAVRVSAEDLSAIRLPAILYWNQAHFVVLERWTGMHAWILDPARGRERLSGAELARQFSGVLLTFSPTERLTDRPARRIDWLYYARLLWQDPRLFGLVIAVSLLLQSTGLATPVLTRIAVDRLIGAKEPAILFTLLAGLVSVGLFQALLMYVRSRLVIRLQAVLNVHLSTQFMAHLFRLPIEFFEQRSTGDLASRLSSLQLVKEALAGRGASLILDTLLLLTYGIAMAVESWLLTGMVVVAAGLQLIMMLALSPRVRKLTRQELAAGSQMAGYLVEALHSMPLVKAAGIEEFVLAQWRSRLEAQVTISASRDRYGAAMESILGAIRLMVPLLLLGVGAQEIIDGQRTLGAVLGFSSLAGAFLAPISSLAGSIQQLQMLGGAIERIEDVMGAEPEPSPAEPVRVTVGGAVSLDQVSFSHGPGSPEVLKGVSLQVRPGQKVALVGETGSGKSTIIKLILGLYEPTAGHVAVDGIDLRRADRRQIRRQVGVVLQEAFLFDDTIHDNIAFHRSLSQADIEWASRMALLDLDLRRMPMGYQTRVGEQAQNLSGGQRQKLAIARALAGRPALLILDEATSQLDAMTERQLEENLRATGITRIVIAHRLTTVTDADLIVLLDQGEIVEQGTHAALLEQGGRYAQLWYSTHERDRRQSGRAETARFGAEPQEEGAYAGLAGHVPG